MGKRIWGPQHNHVISKSVAGPSFCFVALRPKSTAMSLWPWWDGKFTQPHFYLGKLEQAVNQYFVHILSLVTDNNPS